MRSRTSHFMIGLFVIAGIALGTAGVIALGAGSAPTEFAEMETCLTESVSGLDVGAPVRYRGIKIGEVTETGLAPVFYDTQLDYVIVRFKVMPQKKGASAKELADTVRALLPKGLRVRLSSQGITGLAYLESEVVPDAATKYPPLPRDWVKPGEAEARTYVPAVPSTLTDITESVKAVLEELSALDLKGLIEETKKAIQRIDSKVNDLDVAGIGADARGLLADGRQMLKSVEGRVSTALESWTAAGRRVDDVGADAQKIMNDRRVGTILDNVAKATGSAEALLGDPAFQKLPEDVAAFVADVRQTLAKVDGAVGEVRRLASSAAGLVDNNDRQVAAILENLVQTTQHLSSLSSVLDRYPSYLLFGNPPPKPEPGK